MRASFLHAYAFTLSQEGGFANAAHDPGGRTENGVTQHTYDLFRHAHISPIRDVRQMTHDERQAIYLEIWRNTGCDGFAAGDDLALFDWSFHSGRGHISCWRGVDAICEARLHFLKHLSTWHYFGGDWGRRVQECREAAHGLVAK